MWEGVNLINKMKELFIFRIVAYVLKKQCPNQIVMMGEGAADKDCYVAYIFREDSLPFLKIEGVDSEKIYGKAISDGYGYDKDTSVEIASIGQKQLVIEHYVGFLTLRFEGVFDFIFSKLTQYHYLKYRAKLLLHKIDVYAFSKRRLPIVRKQQLLSLLVDRKLERPDRPISAIDLMTYLHSMKWIAHPDSDSEETRLELYLDALCESGELEKNNDGYWVKPMSVVTLEMLQDEVRKHEEIAKTQKRLVHVTWALVGVTFLLFLGELLKFIAERG
jgi:hypothetical protein